MGLLFTLLSSFPANSAELTWRKNKSVDANIAGLPVTKVLAKLAGASGWKIYVEAGLEERVTAKFTNVSQGEALKLLLGNLNYAMVPDGEKGRLYVYRNTLSAATNLIEAERAKAKNWLASEILITLPPGSDADVEKLAKELGGKIVAKSDELNAYRLQFPDADKAESARQALAARNDLDAQDNFGLDRPGNPSAGSASVSPSSLFPLDPKPVAPGEQITVALVDTPIQPLDGKMKDFVLPSIHVTDVPGSLPSEPTHSTSMASTILSSMALEGAGADGSNLGNVRILPVDIYGTSETTTTFEVAQGLYKAIQANPNIINLSLGGSGDSPMVEYLLEMAQKKNILVFASAGNTPTTEPNYPAASPYVIGVTASTYNGEIASYANRGSFVDVKAPGTSRVSYNGQYYLSTGTSTATAFISGQAAALTAQGLNYSQTSGRILNQFSINNPVIQRVPRR